MYHTSILTLIFSSTDMSLSDMCHFFDKTHAIVLLIALENNGINDQ